MVPNDRSRTPLSIGIGWAYRVTSLGLEFALPALAGHGIDLWLATAPVGILIGAALGFAVGMMHLIRLARGGTATRH